MHGMIEPKIQVAFNFEHNMLFYKCTCEGGDDEWEPEPYPHRADCEAFEAEMREYVSLHWMDHTYNKQIRDVDLVSLVDEMQEMLGGTSPKAKEVAKKVLTDIEYDIHWGYK